VGAQLFWRLDGIPVWEDVNLIARENHPYGFNATDALRFMRALTRRLQVSTENVLPAFDPELTTTEPAGYVLPIRRRQAHGILRWSSQWWFPSLERIVLLQGDSPIGYRIPTEAAPWIAPDEIEYGLDEFPFADRVKLPREKQQRMDLFETEPEADSLPQSFAPPKQRGNSSVPSCAFKFAMAGFMFRCPTRPSSRITSTWWPRSRTPANIWVCPSGSKGMLQLPTQDWVRSASRPTPVCLKSTCPR